MKTSVRPVWRNWPPSAWRRGDRRDVPGGPGGDENGATSGVIQGNAEERVEAGPLELVAFDAVVEEQLAMLRLAVADHGLDLFGRAREGDAKPGGPARAQRTYSPGVVSCSPPESRV